MAFLRFFEKKIIREKSFVDTKTGDFKQIEGAKKVQKNEGAAARAELDKPAKDLAVVEPKPPKVVELEPEPKKPETATVRHVAEPEAEGAPRIKVPEKAEDHVAGAVEQVEKDYNDEEEYIQAQIDRWTAANKGSPFDTGPSGSDGTQRGNYKTKGRAVVLDNIYGKKYRVNRDLAKADTIKNYVSGEDKVLDGEPLVCIDAAQKVAAEAFGAKVPKGNRSVSMFERFAIGRKNDYDVYNVNARYNDMGKFPKLPIACKPGDMITLGYTNDKGRVVGGRHIVVVTRVDQNGLPIECVNSSAITAGVGKRPFFENQDTAEFTDYDGDFRSAAAVYENVVIKKIIRPRAIHQQYLAYKRKQQETMVASADD